MTLSHIHTSFQLISHESRLEFLRENWDFWGPGVFWPEEKFRPKDPNARDLVYFMTKLTTVFLLLHRPLRKIWDSGEQFHGVLRNAYRIIESDETKSENDTCPLTTIHIVYALDQAVVLWRIACLPNAPELQSHDPCHLSSAVLPTPRIHTPESHDSWAIEESRPERNSKGKNSKGKNVASNSRASLVVEIPSSCGVGEPYDLNEPGSQEEGQNSTVAVLLAGSDVELSTEQANISQPVREGGATRPTPKPSTAVTPPRSSTIPKLGKSSAVRKSGKDRKRKSSFSKPAEPSTQEDSSMSNAVTPSKPRAKKRKISEAESHYPGECSQPSSQQPGQIKPSSPGQHLPTQEDSSAANVKNAPSAASTPRGKRGRAQTTAVARPSVEDVTESVSPDNNKIQTRDKKLVTLDKLCQSMENDVRYRSTEENELRFKLQRLREEIEDLKRAL
ncbi:hypothetical protein SODALDRAFT_359440 [Sodiomyces alkalinus F11]|uniref:Uncharacterized protein n=1 Tax=Sodiomyces alkalinus (strain CBS 110278 / VKM F-3762 / F11) TaxID=1314773 RepID=A0A3N2PV55_SODAK|nr:hypothetical protein SODALDRAFT_359440 [Sodiomyces alkalinus F11]ROT38354.1 hypothetical protein SODALDRAFT_359440 [Sodiomyces alkalinus F11]